MTSEPTLTALTRANRLCSLLQCEKAIPWREQACFLRPGDPDIHCQLGFCYSGTCCAHNLVSADIAIYHFRRALSELTAEEDGPARAEVLSALGNTYSSSPGNSKSDLSLAVDCHRQAAAFYWAAGRPEDWAREEHNLGNCWCELPEVESSEKWLKAIEHYQRALAVRTRSRMPEQYSATLQNLGTAYRELKIGDRAKNIRLAIECYHEALRALHHLYCTPKQFNLQNNLGNAFLSLAQLGNHPLKNAQRAVHHFNHALALRSRNDSPCDYALAEFNLSTVFLELAGNGVPPADSLLPARRYLEEAREMFARCGKTKLAQEASRRLDIIAIALSEIEDPSKTTRPCGGASSERATL